MTIEHAQKIAQDCLKSMPAIVLGSGASAAHGMPTMEDLKRELVNEVGKLPLSKVEKTEWNALKQSLKTLDLESALQNTSVGIKLLDKIVFITWKYVAYKDIKVFKGLASNEETIALSRLYKYLFESANQFISVITTNYDCLAEYAADISGFDHYTGFRSGFIRELNFLEYPLNKSLKGESKRQIDIWKVHGSINWFLKSGNYLCLPHSIDWDEDFTPLIVTPGNEKYRITHNEPFRDIGPRSDLALLSAKSFLCIGYGFNDEHIQPKLVKGYCKDNKPLVIITKQLTEAAKEFFKKTTQTNFLAIESDGKGSRVFTQENVEGFSEGSVLWDLDNFLNWAIGK